MSSDRRKDSGEGRGVEGKYMVTDARF